MTPLSRRGFIVGLLAAPIIVRPGILMPVKPIWDGWYRITGATTISAFVEPDRNAYWLAYPSMRVGDFVRIAA